MASPLPFKTTEYIQIFLICRLHDYRTSISSTGEQKEYIVNISLEQGHKLDLKDMISNRRPSKIFMSNKQKITLTALLNQQQYYSSYNAPKQCNDFLK